jgi:hypothetical protein
MANFTLIKHLRFNGCVRLLTKYVHYRAYLNLFEAIHNRHLLSTKKKLFGICGDTEHSCMFMINALVGFFLLEPKTFHRIFVEFNSMPQSFCSIGHDTVRLFRLVLYNRHGPQQPKHDYFGLQFLHPSSPKSSTTTSVPLSVNYPTVPTDLYTGAIRYSPFNWSDSRLP